MCTEDQRAKAKTDVINELIVCADAKANNSWPILVFRQHHNYADCVTSAPEPRYRGGEVSGARAGETGSLNSSDGVIRRRPRVHTPTRSGSAAQSARHLSEPQCARYAKLLVPFESAPPIAPANATTRRGDRLWVRMLVVSVDRAHFLLRVQTHARAVRPSHHEVHPLILWLRMEIGHSVIV